MRCFRLNYFLVQVRSHVALTLGFPAPEEALDNMDTKVRLAKLLQFSFMPNNALALTTPLSRVGQGRD